MQKNITANIVLIPKTVPPGTVEGKFRVWLTAASGEIISQQDVDTPTASFNNINAGTYSVTAVRLDAAGGTISDAVTSDPFTIQDDAAPASVTISVPASISVSVE